MPELPDVEVYKRYLDATSLHQTITAVEVKSARILQDASAQNLSRTLRNRQFLGTKRHGKYLFVKLDRGPWLTLHFGMTGYLKYFKHLNKDPEHDRLLVSFGNGFHVAYVCQRKLGSIGLVKNIEGFIKEKQLGPDALEINFEGFKQALTGKRGMIKSTLMNQKYLAGLGNVYTDEILFQSGLHPKIKTASPDEKMIRKLFDSMREVLTTAIEAQADPARFPSSYLTPRRHEQSACPRCGRILKTLKVSGRSTYFCPKCQGR